MNNLKRLMMEFSILGMEPEAVEAENGLEFPEIDPSAVAPEEEYELDAEGNPILDANGNPIPKAKAGETASTCSCNHTDNTLPAATMPTGDVGATMPGAPVGEPIDSQLPPEDEFDFNF